MSRDPIVAVIMGIIPFVNLYLIYKWWEELKAVTKEDYNSIVKLILCLIPIVQLYFLWKLVTDIEKQAQAKGMEGFPLGGTVLYIISIIFVIPGLYLIYKGQEMLNALEA
jgi:hypothetical protein